MMHWSMDDWGWRVAFLFGIGVSVLSLRIWYLAWLSARWPTVEGVVVESKVVRSKGSEGQVVFQPEVRYSYEVRGVAFESKRIGYHMKGGTTAAASSLSVSDFMAGERVQVHYDPKKPKRAVLRAGWSWNNLLLVLISVGLTCGAAPKAFRGFSLRATTALSD